MNEGKASCGKPSRGRYVQGCRCYLCRVANADYAREYRKSTKAMVTKYSTAKARKKVQAWLDEGYSLREIFRATGVGRNPMRTLMTGKHHNAATFKNGRPRASKRMSRANYDKIMKCDRICAPRPNQIVDATALNNALAYLYAHGVTPYRVAKESGIPLGSIYSIGSKEKCTVKTLARLTAAAPTRGTSTSTLGGDGR